MELDRILRDGDLRALFQPIVHLDSGALAGYEALARGPAGSPLERPAELLAVATAAGRLVELDWACRHAALEAVRTSSVPASCFVSLNAEPRALTLPPPSVTDRLLRDVASRVPLLVEVTERDVVDDPAELLRTVNWARTRGLRIAVDDVGACPQVLALLPVIAPDVIKLDLRLVQQRPDAEIAEIFGAVNTEAERTGASILAEGVETDAHRFVARSLGATLAQGWLFGRPGALDADGRQPRAVTGAPSRPAGVALATSAPRHAAVPTPFELGRRRRPVRSATKELLIQVSRHLEERARAVGRTCLVLATFQYARHFTPATMRRYATLADRVAFVASFGEGMPVDPLPGVRGAALDVDDPVIGEWSVVVVGAQTAAALVARDLGDRGPDLGRRFEYVLTSDIDVVARMAGSLLTRVHPLGQRQPLG